MARIPRVTGRPAAPPPPRPSSPAPTPIRRDIQDWDDPYREEEHYENGAVCRLCGAVYHEGRWVLDEDLRQQLTAALGEHPVVCAGCQKQTGRDPGGVVTLVGPFWRQHWHEIIGLIRNEAAQARQENPTSHLIDIRERDDTLEVTTTNEFLGRRLGEALHNAYKGDVEYTFSRDNKLVRVRWQR
ncbi:MAG: ATPase [Armatimonadetes bacterium]|nr:ATPase [Armatimonadota bacterium]